MRLLLRLYPREWRCRYGAEMEAVLGQAGLGPRETVDLLRGALDAHVHPQWPWRRRRPLMWTLLGFLVFLAGVQSRWLAVTLGLAFVAATVAIGHRLVEWQPLRRFGALVAVRLLSDGFLLPIVHSYATSVYVALGWHMNGIAFGLTASLVQVAVWGTVAIVVLRRTSVGRLPAFAVGCLLEVGLGSSGVSLTSPFQGQLTMWLHGYAEPLRIALWAAVLTLVAGFRRSRPDWGGEPPEGAAVPARPLPDPPEPLVARANR